MGDKPNNEPQGTLVQKVIDFMEDGADLAEDTMAMITEVKGSVEENIKKLYAALTDHNTRLGRFLGDFVEPAAQIFGKGQKIEPSFSEEEARPKNIKSIN